MKIEHIVKWDRIDFYFTLIEKLENLQRYYEIIDIKYSTFYDSLNHKQNYSALIIFKEQGK